jgi:D-glycero-D-manno-heptose 1,7-bisphosphate phosphatase
MPLIGLRPAIFLDRDGVLIENRDDYVKSIAEVAFIPGALEALARLAHSPYLIVIATNQSAIGRGLLAQATAEAINTYIVEQLTRIGGRVDGVYICPHRPEDECPCRKPAPGMLLDAARDLGIDLANSVLIGDALSDILAAQAAGVTPILVRTGRGQTQQHALARAGSDHILVVPNVAAAIEQLTLTKTPPG